MPKSLGEIFPPPEELVNLEPEDIAALLLEYFNQTPDPKLHRYNFTLNTGALGQYAGPHYPQVAKVVTEGWMVLEREGLIAPEPGNTGEWKFMTRRGKALRERKDFQAYQQGNLLPPESLDPILAAEVRPLFLRGDYDTAVFRAFKEVEVCVRKEAGLPDGLIGVQLMRTAFHPEEGPLTDNDQLKGEREAVSHLFAGAIGLFKNPSSHRKVSYGPEEVVLTIKLANFLLWWTNIQGLLRRPAREQSSTSPSR